MQASSPPTRGRGSKQRPVQSAAHTDAAVVAPYAGAWIETPDAPQPRCWGSVAPYAGAWIETSGFSCFRPAEPVAPYAGAWIETRS